MGDDFRRSVIVFLGAALLVALLFFPSSHGYFVADDHPVILRNTGATLTNILSWFSGSRYGWYRPLFDVYIAAASNLYGLNAIGYQVTSMTLFGLVAVMVGILGWVVSQDRRVALGGGLLFILQSCHSEAVMWISSANELLAGLWTLSSIACYIQFRRSGRLRWFLLATLTCILAFASKETALFLPVMLAVTDLLFYRRFTGRPLKPLVFLPLVPFVLLAIAAAVVRVSQVTYSVSYHPLQLAKNLVYYLLLETVAFPVVATDLVAPVSYAPVMLASIALAAGGVLLIGTRRGQQAARPLAPALMFAVALALLALVPVVPIVTERTTFLSSAGVALALALLGVLLWDGIASHPSLAAKAAILIAVLYLGANVFVLLDRNRYWRVAGSESKAVISQLGAYVSGLPDHAEVWLIGLPDQVGHAYVFRNAFPDAAVLKGYRPIVNSVLDADLEKMPAPEQAELFAEVEARPNALLLWYHNGALTPVKP